MIQNPGRSSPLIQYLLLLLATGAEASKSDFEKLHLLTLRQGADVNRHDQIAFHIIDLAALTPDEMMMMLCVRVESDATRLEDLFNHPFLLQPVERVINGRARSHREFAVDHLQNLFGSRMVMRRLHKIYNGASLWSHLQPARLRHCFDYLS